MFVCYLCNITSLYGILILRTTRDLTAVGGISPLQLETHPNRLESPESTGGQQEMPMNIDWLRIREGFAPKKGLQISVLFEVDEIWFHSIRSECWMMIVFLIFDFFLCASAWEKPVTLWFFSNGYTDFETKQWTYFWIDEFCEPRSPLTSFFANMFSFRSTVHLTNRL